MWLYQRLQLVINVEVNKRTDVYPSNAHKTQASCINSNAANHAKLHIACKEVKWTADCTTITEAWQRPPSVYCSKCSLLEVQIIRLLKTITMGASVYWQVTSFSVKQAAKISVAASSGPCARCGLHACMHTISSDNMLVLLLLMMQKRVHVCCL